MKNYRNIGLLMLFGGLSYSSFISTLVLLFLKDKISDPVYLSLAIVSQKIIKVFFETPTGVLADIYGVRKLFFAVPFLMMISMLLFSLDSVTGMLLCIIIHGISVSIKNGKIEGSIYNVLQKEKKEHLFSKIISLNCMFTDLMIGAVSYFNACLYKQIGIKGLFIITTIKSALLILVLMALDDKDMKYEKREKPGKILIESFKFIRKSKVVLMGALMLTLYNFLGWQFSQTYKVLFSDQNVSTAAIGKFYGFTHIIMSIGCALSILLVEKISILSSVFIWLSEVLIILFLSFSSAKVNLFNDTFPIVGIGFLMYPLIYPMVQIKILQYMEDKLIPSRRMTITSFVNLLNIMANVAFNILIGIMAKRFSYTTAVSLILSILVLIGSAQIVLFIKENRKIAIS